MGHSRDQVFICSDHAEGTPCVIEALSSCSGGCEMSCCGKPLAAATPKTADQGKEKHVPVVEKIDGGYKVKVGDVPHPMEEAHFIQFIELRAGDEIQRKYLKPGAAPEAIFKTDATEVTAIEFCNVHGLWQG